MLAVKFLNIYISSSYKNALPPGIFWVFLPSFFLSFLFFVFPVVFRSILCHSVSWMNLKLKNFFILSKGIFKVYFLPLFKALKLIGSQCITKVNVSFLQLNVSFLQLKIGQMLVFYTSC
jgi:hypothetical protein